MLQETPKRELKTNKLSKGYNVSDAQGNSAIRSDHGALLSSYIAQEEEL